MRFMYVRAESDTQRTVTIVPASIVDDPHAWRGVRVLVTGASGFIGSHLVSRLTAMGAEVHAVSRRPGHGPAWHVVDLTDVCECIELVKTVAPDVIFHLASAVSGARDLDLVVPLMAANQAAAVNLLTAVAKSAPPTRVVLAGSIEEPHRGHDATPQSPYAAAKWAATSYARMFAALWDVRVSVLQIAMVYGPAQPDVAKLVPYAALALLSGESPQLSSGTRLVDWVYVDDVVDALVRTAWADRTIGKVFDVCSGRLVSIRDTVELLASIVGGEARPQFSAVADRPMDHAQRGDPRPAAELLDWRAVTPLEDGLRKTVAWHAQKFVAAPIDEPVHETDRWPHLSGTGKAD
jgi:nucleoside-diphosphate-sugar epimerase